MKAKENLPNHTFIHPRRFIMAKRNRSQARAVLENRVRQGRGQGSGADYVPWLLVHDVSSMGRSSRIAYGGRVAHTLSDWETAAFRDFQWDPHVIGIEEQKPLEQSETLRIAREAGIRHPREPRTGEPIVCTTDLVVTRNTPSGPIRLARAVKEISAVTMDQSKTPRQLVWVRHRIAKLEIERRYWTERGVHWMLLTEEHLSKTRKANIEVILAAQPDPERPEGYWQSALNAVHFAVLEARDRELEDVARRLAAAGTVNRRDFPVCIYLLCRERHLAFDMNRQFLLSRPASDFFVPQAAS